MSTRPSKKPAAGDSGSGWGHPLRNVDRSHTQAERRRRQSCDGLWISGTSTQNVQDLKCATLTPTEATWWCDSFLLKGVSRVSRRVDIRRGVSRPRKPAGGRWTGPHCPGPAPCLPTLVKKPPAGPFCSVVCREMLATSCSVHPMKTPIRNQPDDAMRRTYMLMGVAAILAFLVLLSLVLRLLSS
jgi:hypothetical protein